jgi:methionyl-tRNA formyltransferase
VKLCIAGKNNIAVDCLEYVLKFLKKEDVCIILNKNDKYKNTWQKSLGFYGKINNIETTTLDEIQKVDNLIFLSLEYDRIIKPEIFKTDKLFNIHFSLLPEYKGMYTSLLPILHGKRYSGVTLHKIDKGIDTGDIIDQIKFDISNLTCKELYYRYLEEGTKLICKNFYKILENRYILMPQANTNSSYYGKLAFNLNEVSINQNQTAFQIHQFVKALNFRVYQLPKFKEFEIYKSQITSVKSKYKPGTILYEDDEKIEIATIDYNMVLFKDYYNQLLTCCRINDIQHVKQFIKFIPDINEIEPNGWNPLIIACYNGAYDMVKFLIKEGADTKFTNLNGTTTLMYAKDSYLRTRNISIIQLLLENGVKIEKKDIFGKSVLDYISDDELINFLQNYQ